MVSERKEGGGVFDELRHADMEQDRSILDAPVAPLPNPGEGGPVYSGEDDGPVPVIPWPNPEDVYKRQVLTGVNLDEAGKPTRWKIENSWGDKNGEKGYYVCSDSWFDQYVFQAAVEREYLGGLADLAAQEPIVLEPWDPMGTLAD